jgi:hypothetical protein
MKRATLRNFHVPLPEDLYNRLREEADRSKQPATETARQAIESWLEQRRKTALHEAIAAYAGRHAGTPVDLDEALEAASLEHLRVPEEPAQ